MRSYGFETVLQEELTELGYPDCVKGNRAVSLKGTWSDVYFLNLHSRCALSVLVEICKFPFKNEQDVYDDSASIRWSALFHEKNTIAKDNLEISETHWESALNEYQSENRKNGLWAKLYSENNGKK